MARPRQHMIRLLGNPEQLDIVLRVLARWILVPIALLATALTAWFAGRYWAPLPIVVCTLGYQFFFWFRGDRSIRLQLSPDGVISLKDRKAGQNTELSLREVTSAKAHYRPFSNDRNEVVVTLANDSQVLLGLRFLVGKSVPMLPQDVDVDAMDRLIGAYGGLLPSLVPAQARCRQTIDDPAGQALAWLRERLGDRWGVTSVRVWKGKEPKLDLFGLHEGPSDGLLTLEGDQWTLRTNTGARSGFTFLRSSATQRTVDLTQPGQRLKSGEPVTAPVDLPCLLLELAPEIQINFPAPTLAAELRQIPLDDDMLHMHAAEGGALLWHILPRWPQSAWPSALRAHLMKGDLVGGQQDSRPKAGLES